MKKGILILLTTYCVISSNAQGLSFSTVRDVYQFSVGDTFIFHSTCPTPSLQYDIEEHDYMWVVTSKDTTSFQDTITYSISTYPGGQNFLLVYSNLDSIIFYNRPDNSGTNLTLADTAFQIIDSFSNRKITERIMTLPFSGPVSTHLQFVDGLGQTYYYYNSYNFDPIIDPCVFREERITYYHKGSEVWGNFTDLTTAINQVGSDLSKFKVNPNPFSNQLTFSFADNEQTKVSLYDFIGQQVLQQTFTNSTTINTEQMQDGIYFYELRNDKGTIKTGKVVKQ